MDKVATGIVGVAIGIYAIRVALAGNGKELLNLIMQEEGFIEVIIAMYLLWLLHKNKATNEFTDQLVMAAAIAALLKAATSNGNLIEELQKFGSGQQGLLETGKNIFGL